MGQFDPLYAFCCSDTKNIDQKIENDIDEGQKKLDCKEFMECQLCLMNISKITACQFNLYSLYALQG